MHGLLQGRYHFVVLGIQCWPWRAEVSLWTLGLRFNDVAHMLEIDTDYCDNHSLKSAPLIKLQYTEGATQIK